MGGKAIGIGSVPLAVGWEEKGDCMGELPAASPTPGCEQVEPPTGPPSTGVLHIGDKLCGMWRTSGTDRLEKVGLNSWGVCGCWVTVRPGGEIPSLVSARLPFVFFCKGTLDCLAVLPCPIWTKALVQLTLHQRTLAIFSCIYLLRRGEKIKRDYIKL